MGSVRLGVGTEWLLDGRSFRIVRQLGPHEFIAEDLKFRLERSFSEQELLDQYAQGRLRFVPNNLESEAATSSERPATMAVIAPAEFKKVSDRWLAIEPLTQLDRPPTESDF